MEDTKWGEPIIRKTWEERLKYIERINNFNLETTSIEEIETILSEMQTGFHHVTFDFPPGMNLFRLIRWGRQTLNMGAYNLPTNSKSENKSRK
jgi:hypothetical protein